MLANRPRQSVALFDRFVEGWWVLFLIGITGIVVSILGEFVFHWWKDAGTWGLWLSLGAAIVAATLGASRWQANRLSGGLAEVRSAVVQVGASTQRIEANTEAIPRIEANTAGIPRLEASTAEVVRLLREIRDRLPSPEG